MITGATESYGLTTKSRIYDHDVARLGGFPANRAFDPEALPALIEELRDLMAGRNLTQLINSVVVPTTTVVFTRGESLADGDSTSTWAAKVEYLVGVALSVDPAGDADTPPNVTQRVRQLISDIFDADQARIITASLVNADAEAGDSELLLQQLRLEYQADRMPGYAVHLEQVDAEVFGRHRDYYITGLGFDPADVIRATRRHTRSVNQAFRSARDAVTTALNSGARNPAVGETMRKAFDGITLWEPNEVAASTGIAVEQITAMLDFFSTEYGCQPEFRAPGDQNRARTHPCIKLDDRKYFVPDPWSLSAAIHQRLGAEPKRNDFDPHKYYKHRQDAHERLVAGALERVFGTANVHSTQHYALASGDRGEIDSLVSTEWPLVVEAKAIALTESGRRGAPGRVEAKVKAMLGKALDQTDRALTYILDEGGRSFAPTENGRPVELLPGDISGSTAVIVMFERIDPFASGGLAVARVVKRPTWVVSLTDMLMVADVLTDPAAFHHYARTRADVQSAEVSAAEADALGAYLHDRLRMLKNAVAERDTRIFIGYSCEALNDFYTQEEAGLEAHELTTGVPDEVISALANTLTQRGWVRCVDIVMTADSSVWPKWNRFRRKHRRGGTFTLNGQVSLVSVRKANSSLEQAEDSISLNIPAPS